MSRKPLDRLAEAYGIQLSYLSTTRKKRTPSDDAKRATLRAMGIAADNEEAIAESLAHAPAAIAATLEAPQGARCYAPQWLADGRIWGITCQLYGLRSARNCGIGDFEDLARLAESAAAAGGDFIGVNPLHALFTAAPHRCSPFSPSNRRFLNPLYIALDRVPGITAAVPLDEVERRRLGAASQVDYDAVSVLKLVALRALWRQISVDPGLWQSSSRRDFEAFVAEGGEPLSRHALFEALSHRMVAEGRGSGWHGWPQAYHGPRCKAVQDFASDNDDEVRFHSWLQWIADSQLRRAAERARAAGMRLGLYLDIAVGTAPDGSATWSDPELVVPGASIGSPPDAFFSKGQDWGLAPMSPAALRARGFAPFREMLSAAMKHAGAIRIDHAMGLHRLFWIPKGFSPVDACYVSYPMADMLRTLAEASVARRSIVIGEDLGTVPKGFSKLMRGLQVQSCRVLYFQKIGERFRAAASYPRNALVSVSTHDLPPLAGWWVSDDVARFRSLGLLDADGERQRYEERGRDRRALLERVRRDTRYRDIAASLGSPGGDRPAALPPEIAVAVHAFVARTPSRLFGVQFEDLCGAEAPVNIPGTSDEYPNWRQRAPLTLEEAPGSRLWSAIVDAVARERPRSA